MTNGLLIWIFLVSTVAALLFSTLSYTLRTMSRVQLEEALLARRRSHAMESILRARSDLALLASILRLVCNTIGILAVGEFVRSRYPNTPPGAITVFGWTVLVTVPVMMIFSVAIPQAWAKYAGEWLLAFTWPLLRAVYLLMWPLARVLHVFDEIVRRLAGVSFGDEPENAAEQVQAEILSMVAEGEAEGTVDEEQKKMIEGVISFRDLQVGQIMTPRTDIVAVDVNAAVLELRDKILRDGLSRVPVYEGTLDNVVGILYAKDLLTYLGPLWTTGVIEAGSGGDGAQHDGKVLDLRKIMRPPLFVPRTKPLRDLLREFRIQQVHMAIVLDEYGGTSGLVTTEDIVEEIVGSIADEFERPPPEEIKRIDEHTVEVDARMYISELNRALGLNFPEDGDFQTIGGFVISTMGAIPARGERLEHEGVAIIVIDAEPRRVKKIRLELPELAGVEVAEEEEPVPPSLADVPENG